jgi:uncharacterized RDD family membrane protein YckC
VQAEHVHGFGRRAGGRVIDMVTHQILAVVAGVIAGVTIAVLETGGIVPAGSIQSMGKHGFLFNMLAGSLASLVGTTAQTAICGASVGKAILGMRVVRLDGSRPGLGASLVRELGYFIDVFFFGLVGKAAMDASALAERYGDQWAGTAVVRADHAGGSGRPSGLRIAVGLLVGAFLYGPASGAPSSSRRSAELVELLERVLHQGHAFGQSHVGRCVQLGTIFSKGATLPPPVQEQKS